jgi:hypothetical protein
MQGILQAENGNFPDRRKDPAGASGLLATSPCFQASDRRYFLYIRHSDSTPLAVRK